MTIRYPGPGNLSDRIALLNCLSLHKTCLDRLIQEFVSRDLPTFFS